MTLYWQWIGIQLALDWHFISNGLVLNWPYIDTLLAVNWYLIDIELEFDRHKICVFIYLKQSIKIQVSAAIWGCYFLNP